MLNPAIQKAYVILDGTVPDRALFGELARLRGDDILDLVSLASKVRNRFSPGFHACTIMNAKSGMCGEDCRFCSQSSRHETGIERFPLADAAEMVARAGEAYAAGVESFGIVTSGAGYQKVTGEFRKILDAIDAIHTAYPGKNVCATLGHLSEETARELARRDISHYNINIQTNPARYRDLVASTHGIDDRIETIRLLKKNGVKVCAGGIFGLGESMEDRLEMALALRDLDVDIIPLNVLIPIPGTPLAGREPVSAAETALSIALFRLIHPAKTIKFAAGRETRMKDFQGLLMLAGANGIITGGYLTTRGRDVSDDREFIQDLETFR